MIEGGMPHPFGGKNYLTEGFAHNFTEGRKKQRKKQKGRREGTLLSLANE